VWKYKPVTSPELTQHSGKACVTCSRCSRATRRAVPVRCAGWVRQSCATDRQVLVPQLRRRRLRRRGRRMHGSQPTTTTCCRPLRRRSSRAVGAARSLAQSAFSSADSNVPPAVASQPPLPPRPPRSSSPPPDELRLAVGTYNAAGLGPLHSPGARHARACWLARAARSADLVVVA
jgi:hypothetical protein